MKVFLENLFLLLVDFLGAIPRSSLPGYCSYPSAAEFWLLICIAGPPPENWSHLARDITPATHTHTHPLCPPGQWLTGMGIQKAVPTLWCNSRSGTPCGVWFNLDSRLDHFLAWLFSPAVSASFTFFLQSVLAQ